MASVAWRAPAVSLAVALLAAAAHADEAPPERVRLVQVRAALAGTSARIAVQYRVAVAAPSDGATRVELELPDGGVVTRASITQGGAAHVLALGAREALEEQFLTLFEDAVPATRGRTWAALLARDDDRVVLQIGAPLAASVLVDLEVIAPTCFWRDTRYVQVPQSWEARAHGVRGGKELLEACHGSDRVDGARDEDEQWFAVPVRDAARLPAGERVAPSTARLAVDDTLHVARTEVALAAQLSEVPADLATVILVDESRSMSEPQLRSQRAVVAGYLDAAPRSRVHAIGFSRRPRALTAGWMLAAQAAPRIERELAGTAPRNGSNVDLALDAAARVLAGVRGTRRVVIVTDGALAQRLAHAPEQLAARVPAGTLIHVVIADDVPDADDVAHPRLARDDEAPLAVLAAATGGMTTRIGAADPQVTPAIDAMALVRPTSLDRVRVTGLGWTDLDASTRLRLPATDCPPSLREGESCIWWSRGGKFAGAIQLEGVLWGRRFVRIVRPLGDPQRSVARELAARAVAESLAEPGPRPAGTPTLAELIDRHALAVTRSTSMFARWGTPTQIFSAWLGSTGFTSHTPEVPIGFSTGTFGTAGKAADLRAMFAPAVATCRLGGAHATLRVELTFDEIVDVQVTVTGAGERTTALASCVEEAVWSVTPVLSPVVPSRVETLAF